MEKTIFGTESNNIVAFCCHHKSCMTVKQMKNKKCLQKQCHHLQKREKHEFWGQRERLKAKKKANRQAFMASVGGY